MDQTKNNQEDKIILICATGRSGSTTIQRIINTMPNTNICGENYGAIISLLDFYRKLKLTTFDQVPGNITPFKYDYLIKKNFKPSWYNSYHITNMKEMIRDTIIKMFKKDETIKIWGFKEIRYDNGRINYIKDFLELFPNTKVIIQIRENIVEQSKSGWFKNDKPEASLQYLKKYNKELIDFYNSNKQHCFFITFERMFKLTNIQQLFGFIECEKYYDAQSIQEVLNNNIKD